MFVEQMLNNDGVSDRIKVCGDDGDDDQIKDMRYHQI